MEAVGRVLIVTLIRGQNKTHGRTKKQEEGRGEEKHPGGGQIETHVEGGEGHKG